MACPRRPIGTSFGLNRYENSHLGSKLILATIPEMERAAPLRDLHVDALPTEFVLGLCVKPIHPMNTKREILSALTRSIDPLCFYLSVFTFTKILFQSTFTSRKLDKKAFKPLGWDEPLPIKILAKWNRFASELHLLSQISIERCFRPDR